MAFQRAAVAFAEAKQARDAAIIISSDQGLSRRKVADAAGVTVGRVQQVISGADRKARNDLVDRLLEMASRRLPVESRDRYMEEWRAEVFAAELRPLARLYFALSLLRGSGALAAALVEERPIEKEERP